MKRLAGSLVIAGALSLAACTTTDPYTGEEKTSRGTWGAAIGAGAGAIVGLATGSDAEQRRRRALRGAGIGAVTGAGVGVYMDRQEAELREKMQASGVSITRDGDNIILNMPGNLTFDTNSSNVRPSFRTQLDAVAEVLKKYESTMIEVAGHTDSTGSVDYNMMLSQQRAQSVANVLAGFGVENVRMEIVGFGPHRPVGDNSTSSGREQNRRVELTLLPFTG